MPNIEITIPDTAVSEAANKEIRELRAKVAKLEKRVETLTRERNAWKKVVEDRDGIIGIIDNFLDSLEDSKEFESRFYYGDRA